MYFVLIGKIRGGYNKRGGPSRGGQGGNNYNRGRPQNDRYNDNFSGQRDYDRNRGGRPGGGGGGGSGYNGKTFDISSIIMLYKGLKIN